MNISKRAEDKLLKRVPENHTVRFRHYRVLDEQDVEKAECAFPPNYLVSVSVFKRNSATSFMAPKGGRTICTIYAPPIPMGINVEGGDIIWGEPIAVARGEALCSFSDQFCRRTGRTIALGRALAMMGES